MQYDDFNNLTNKAEPSEKLSGVHLAIWYVVKDDWDMAHSIIQNMNTKTAYWIHAYLHRLEGDLDNANYWYNSARIKPPSGSLEIELNKIIKSVFL